MKIATFTAPRLAVWTFNLLFSRKTWKFVLYGLVIGSLWYSIHTFINTYNIVFSNGVYGLVTEQRWDEIVNSDVEISSLHGQLNEANYDIELARKVRDSINSDILN